MAIPKEHPGSLHPHKPPARRQRQAARSFLSATSPLPPCVRTRRVVSWLAHSPAGTQARGGDLALLSGGDGGQLFWRSCCRLTALSCVLTGC